MKTISILGSTGSIGTQTLDVAQKLGISVFALSAGSNVALMEHQIRQFKPKFAHLYSIEAAKDLRARIKDLDVKVLNGEDGLIEISAYPNVDLLVTAIVGSLGLKPTLAAIENKVNIALANKETLVCAGDIVMKKAKENAVSIIPVDSEHSAIFQCINGNKKEDIKSILLTASGGPFRGKDRKFLEQVTLADALKHPNWSMGKKITIDSATMMNKGLEMIEAKHLFGIDAIKILVHKESIIHSMVEYRDNSVIAQLSVPDMRLPIQYACFYPERNYPIIEPIDFTKISNLSFEEVDLTVFGCLKLAMDALKKGGTMPAALNAANEIAVNAFLKEEITFLQIEQTVNEVLSDYKPILNYTLEDCIETDLELREKTSNIIKRFERKYSI